MKKNIYLRHFLFIALSIIAISCLNYDKKAKSPQKLDEEFHAFIKNKPYTIFYIWTSWCGISRDGLVNDYNRNYEAINNDTVQSMLIVMSDTNSIKNFFTKNNFSLPYIYIYPDKYSILNRNSQDEENKNLFIKKQFNYTCQAPGFPSVLLINNELEVQLEGSETKDALNYYRKIEKLKAQ